MGPVIETLVGNGALDAAKLEEGREIAEGAGLPLVRVLLHLKLVDPAAVAVAMATVTGRHVVHLDKFALPPSPAPSFPAALCRELRVLPLAFEQGEEGVQLVLAMSDPTDQSAGERVAEVIGKNVRPLLVEDAALSRAIARRYEEHPPIRPPPPAPVTQVDQEVLLLDEVDEPSKTDPTPPRSMTASAERAATSEGSAEGPASPFSAPASTPEGEVFAHLTDAPAERTVIMRAPTAPRDRTVMLRNPFLDPISASGATEMRSIIGDARVCFVSRDARARLRVAADLAPLVHDALVVEDLKRAADIAEKEEFDEVVVHAPKNDATSGLLLDRMARAIGHGVVVISSDAAFAELPCVRRRIAPPASAAEIAPLILDGLFSAG